MKQVTMLGMMGASVSGASQAVPVQPDAPRALHLIAEEIKREWKKPYFGAVPYIQAMSRMGSAKEHYGQDPGSDIVARFLCNATSWRGDVARRIKAELKEAAGIK